MTYNSALLIFDFDGTIINSERGIMNSVRYALDKVGRQEPNDDVIRSFIGPPLLMSFQQHYGFDRQDAERLVEYYREYYRPTGYRECEPYEGVLPLLSALRERGTKTAVASTKPEEFVVKIAQELGFAHLFDTLVGARLEDTQADKTRLLKRAAEQAAGGQAEKIVMVGDSKFDILAAKNLGFSAVAVEYGFGTRQEFEQAGADYIVKSVAELEKLLMSMI